MIFVHVGCMIFPKAVDKDTVKYYGPGVSGWSPELARCSTDEHCKLKLVTISQNVVQVVIQPV